MSVEYTFITIANMKSCINIRYVLKTGIGVLETM